MATDVIEIDALAAPESLLLELHSFYVELDKEELPEDPQMPAEQRFAIWRHVPNYSVVRRWVLFDNETIVGTSVLSMNKTENLKNAYFRLYIGQNHRRKGLSRLLAEPILDVALENGRTSLTTDVTEDSEWEPKLESLGMKRSLVDKESRLMIEDVDWDLMDNWIERASERAPEYELLSLETPIPEEHLQKWCDLMLVMNTAPLEDLDWEPFTMSPEKWRSIESIDIARGNPLMAEVAVHKPTGDWVGVSEINALSHQPDLAWQGDTGVDPAHRNKGLGRWLKAAMLKRFVAAHPETERIDTENAGSNEPMLNINIEMGYRPLHVNNAWQGDTAGVRAGLGL